MTRRDELLALLRETREQVAQLAERRNWINGKLFRSKTRPAEEVAALKIEHADVNRRIAALRCQGYAYEKQLVSLDKTLTKAALQEMFPVGRRQRPEPEQRPRPAFAGMDRFYGSATPRYGR